MTARSIAAGWRAIADREARYGTASGKTGEGPRTSVLTSAASSREPYQPRKPFEVIGGGREVA